jgi:hypothetical protein
MYNAGQTVPQGYFSEKTMRHLLPLESRTERWLLRALDAMLACKLTLVYGRYHMMSDLRYLAISEHHESYAQAEKLADLLNQLVPTCHTSPAYFMRTSAEYVDESIDAYKEYELYLNIFDGRFFCPTVAQRFCEMVYEADDYYTFKAFCNLYYSVYAETLLLYQIGQIDYPTFANQFQEIELFNGKRKPMTSDDLKLYLRTMHKIVNLYKSLLMEEMNQCHQDISP